MASRHQRRKAAKAGQADKLERLALAERSRRVSELVKQNRNTPIERNYYPQSSMAGLSETAARAKVTGHSSGLIRASTQRPRWKG